MLAVSCDLISWEALAAIGAIAAACAAAISAWHSKKAAENAERLAKDQIYHAKVERTIAHSPDRNRDLKCVLSSLAKKYPMLKKRDGREVVVGKIDKEFVPDLETAANLWGQMATQYCLGLLDKETAKSVLKWRFIKFCDVFEDWLTRDGRENIYVDTLKLHKLWKGPLK